MTKEELEKEAEEIANKKLCSERICYNHCNFNSPKHHRCGEWHRCYESAKEGANLREKQIEIDAEQIRNLQKQNGELTDKVRELEAQIEKMKSDVKCNVKWADQNKNEQMYCKLNAMFNQWEIKEK